MARVFTTTFQFNHQNYDAIVTMLDHEGEISFKVRLLDHDLHPFVAADEIVFKGNQGYEQMSAMDNTISQSLMRSIGKAIERHLSIIY